MKEAYKYKSFSGTDMVATCHMPVPGTNGQVKSVSSLGSLQTLTYSIHMDRKPIRSIGNINAKGYVMGPRTIAGTLVFAVFNKHFAYEIMENIRKEVNPRYSFMADELPPFDITISYANEYGAQSRLVLYGVQLVNEGQVMSVNDVYTENTYQYVANDMEYLTDVNGYATEDSTNDFIIGTDEQNNKDEITDEYLKDIFAKDKKRNNYEPNAIEAVIIKAQTSSAPSRYEKGIVRINTLPEKKDGSLKIYNSSKKELFDLNLAHHKMPIFIQLEPARYEAVYTPISNNVVSSPTEFVVPVADKTISSNNSAPTIEKVTSTSISILCNDLKHKKMFAYEIDENNNITLSHRGDIEKRKGVVEGLTPNTDYIVITTDENESDKSNRARITTLWGENNKYNDLKDFARYNSNSLKFGSMMDYYNVIDGAKSIADKSTIPIGIVDSIIAYKNNAASLMITLSPSDFNTQTEYEEKIKELKKHQDISFDLINIATVLIYNESDSLNSSTPSMPQLLDLRNSILLLDKDTIKVEVYKGEVYEYEIPISKFKKYKSSGFTCVVSGVPGSKYNVRAVGFNNNKSASLEVYILTDQEKYFSIEDYNKKNTNSIKTIEESREEVRDNLTAYEIDESLEERLIIEHIKQAINPLLSSPEIIDYDSSSITVRTDYKDMMADYGYEYYMCVVEMEKALFEDPVFKIKFNSDSKQVVFTNMSHGVKGKKHYALWIENSIGIQVSNCSTIFTGDTSDEDHVYLEDQRNMYCISEKSDSIINIIERNSVIPIGLKDVYYGIKSDSTTTERNIYTKFISDSLLYSPELPNTSEILKAICKAKFDLDFLTDENYFGDPVSFNKEKMTLTLPNRLFDFSWKMHVVNKEDDEVNIITTHKKNVEDNIINLKDIPNSSYIVLYGVKSDLYTKSGFVFIDLTTKEIYSYKIKAEVIKK